MKKKWFNLDTEQYCGGPAFGDIVTVASSYLEKGILYYNLVEWPPSKPNDGFLSSQFIPLSSIDETEMERNYETEKV